MIIFYHYFNYKFLKLGLFIKKNYLTNIYFLHGKDELNKIVQEMEIHYSKDYQDKESKFQIIVQQLIEYLDGKRIKFDVQYKLNTSNFVTRVLKETEKIPFGKVSTYKEIAKKVGSPKAWRAVGNALASNPIPIIIPCHRVIKSNRKLGGFGGSPELKKRLLEHEESAII